MGNTEDILVVCTLAEGTYGAGVAALINSLHHCGFTGLIVVGYRGEIPNYLRSLPQGSQSSSQIKCNLSIQFIEVDKPGHLAHQKPGFMMRIFDEFKASGVYYFDPDIVVTAPWGFFVEWILAGVAICEDCTYPNLPDTHPFWRTWRDVAASLGLSKIAPLPHYYNSGYVGVARSNLAFLRNWNRLLQVSSQFGADLDSLKRGGRENPFQVPDQDTFNIAIASSGEPLSAVGPDGMGFLPAGYIMQHAVDAPKPWSKKYLLHYLKTGDRIVVSHRAYWSSVSGPVKPFFKIKIIWVRIQFVIVTLLGRFYRR